MSTTATAPDAAQRTHPLPPAEARAAVAQGEAVVIDVREPFERTSAFIPGSHPHPMSTFDAAALRAAHPTARLVFQCKSGARSADAAKRFAQATGDADTWQLAGGIDAWRGAGHPVERSAHAPRLDIMRQVQITAGSLVLVGVLGSLFIHPAVLGLSAFVGAGLVFAGVSGWCGMARLLGRLPWNRAPGPKTKVSCGPGEACCTTN